MSRQSPRSREEMDEDWRKIERHLQKYLDLSPPARPSAEEYMHAYAAVHNLETGRPSASHTRFDGTTVHGIRVRVAKLVRKYRNDHPRMAETEFKDRWELCSKIFTYHDRHYVRRNMEEEGRSRKALPADLVFPDHGVTTMFQLGMDVWRATEISTIG